MQSTSNDSIGMHSGLRVESFFQASENETDTDSDSGAFTANRSRKSNNDEANRLSTPELIRHAFNIAVIKVRNGNERFVSLSCTDDLTSNNLKGSTTDKILLTLLISSEIVIEIFYSRK